jgi:hypothetical protein
VTSNCIGVPSEAKQFIVSKTVNFQLPRSWRTLIKCNAIHNLLYVYQWRIVDIKETGCEKRAVAFSRYK